MASDRIYGIHCGVAFGVPFVVVVLLLFCVLSLAYGVEPTPPTVPPTFPASVEASTNETGIITLSALPLPIEYEWELTFEWVPELGGTNAVVYPIKIQVPFEHDSGFVYVRARKVEK